MSKAHVAGTGTIATTVASVTFREIVRDKVLYNILLCTALLLGLGFLASRMSFLRPDRIVLDFGLSALNLSCSFIATFFGAGMLAREFERRTIFVALARPITRFQFLLGKYVGLAAVLAANWGLLSAGYLAVLLFSGGQVNSTLLLGLLMVLIQSWMIIGIAIVFSSFSTTSLSAMMTIGCYLIGNNISQIRFVAGRVGSPVASALLNSLAAVLPNLEYFNFGTKVTYGLPVAASFWLTSILYAFAICAVSLAISGLLIQWKEA